MTCTKLRVERIEHRVLLAKLEVPVTIDELTELGFDGTPALQQALQTAQKLTQADLDTAKKDATAALLLLDRANRANQISNIKVAEPEIYARFTQIVLNEELMDKFHGLSERHDKA